MEDINTHWDWFSHLPVLKYFIEKHDIELAIEQGSGMYSTPLLKKAKIYKGYEESPEFRNKMIADGIYADIDVELIPMPSTIKLFTKFSELGDLERQILINNYENLYHNIAHNYSQVEGLKLLFIDGFSCSRQIALDSLKVFFDIIVIHDTDTNSYDHYEYNFKDDHYVDTNYDVMTVTTPGPYTTFMVRNGTKVDIEKLRLYMDEFCDLMGLEHDKMEIKIHKP